MLRTVLRDGHRLDRAQPTAEIRARALSNLRRLPDKYLALDGAPRYPVLKSAVLDQMLEAAREKYLGASAGSASGKR